jgi:hypothetical protein
MLIKQSNFLLYKWCQYFQFNFIYFFFKVLFKFLFYIFKNWLKKRFKWKNWRKIKLTFLVTNQILLKKWNLKTYNLNIWNLIFLQTFIKFSDFSYIKKKLNKFLKQCIICKNFVEIKNER